MRRLTDNDRRLGALTYARSSWRPLRLMWCSGDDEHPGNTLTAYAFGWVGRIRLPNLLRPYRRKVNATYWDAATIKHMGRDWYWEIFPREIGFCLHAGHFSLHYGAQTNSSDTTKSRGWFLPWTQWRQVRYSLYDQSGILDWQEINDRRDGKVVKFEERWEAEKACPTVDFLVRDYDGLEVVARTRIEEREWHAGTGWFKWVAFFRSPRISRHLRIEFDKEVGPEKGSWKGGLRGTSINLQSFELHNLGMDRYCAGTHKSKSGQYRIEIIKPLN